MMSATFFRSRFDQLFYMLRMLRSNLPEERDYLDAILNESMVCYIAESARKWITHTNRLVLQKDLRKKYDEIKNNPAVKSEKLYQMLSEFLYHNYTIIDDLKILICKLEKEKCRILIYSRSKDEADLISS